MSSKAVSNGYCLVFIFRTAIWFLSSMTWLEIVSWCFVEHVTMCKGKLIRIILFLTLSTIWLSWLGIVGLLLAQRKKTGSCLSVLLDGVDIWMGDHPGIYLAVSTPGSHPGSLVMSHASHLCNCMMAEFQSISI